MSASEYWIKRMERILLDSEKNALEYEQDLKTAYQKALQAMQTELEAFYQRYAKKNRITYTEARQRLSNHELKTFLQRQRTYLAEVEKLGVNKQYEAYLRQLSGRAYVTKLEEIQANLRYHIETLNVKYEAGLGNLLKGCYEDSFYRTLFDVQKNVGFGVDFTAPGSAQLDAAVREKWNGDNYSGRIWANKDRLVATLNQLIPQEFVRGRSNQEIARDVAERMNVSYSNAVRLVRTEVNYISNKGTIKAYKDSAVVPEFEYVATLDNRTSNICIDMDGKVFPLAQAATGINVPPLHPHCRSTTVPYFKEDDISEPADRVARDETGKTYFVGKDLTYEEWAKQHANPAYYERVKKAKQKYTAKDSYSVNTEIEKLANSARKTALMDGITVDDLEDDEIDVESEEYDFFHRVIKTGKKDLISELDMFGQQTERNTSYVIEDDKGIVAYIDLYEDVQRPLHSSIQKGSVYIANLLSAESGKGYGKALMFKAASIAQQKQTGLGWQSGTKTSDEFYKQLGLNDYVTQEGTKGEGSFYYIPANEIEKLKKRLLRGQKL